MPLFFNKRKQTKFEGREVEKEKGRERGKGNERKGKDEICY
jgi:hypothetical protein